MQAHRPHIFEFGPFRLIESERQLVKAGQPVSLPPKVFDTLLMLVENSGRLVDKQELMSRLWPDSFVEEINLSRSISTLRKALGESAGSPVYIQTVPKSGYRFLADVVEVDGHNSELVFEKHTSAEIITVIEEITDSTGGEASHSALDGSAISRPNAVRLLSRRTMSVSALVLLALLAAIAYLWTSGKLDRSLASAKVKSIAVLPFKHLGTPGDDDHLGLGMADVLITRLSNLKQVNVRPTSAVLRLDQQQDMTAAGRTLGVDAVLEGSIQRIDDRIRVTARLVRVSDQSSIWSGQFDEKARDIFAVQDAISEQVVDSLALNLSAGERAMLTKHYTESADAYQLYVKGRYYWNKRNLEGMTQAQYYFRRATEKDPGFSLAYVGFADVVLTSWDSPEAHSAVQKALEIDGTLGEAYATMGFARMFRSWEWKEAEESFRRAIDLNPGYGTAHQWYAILLAITGRVPEAKREMKRALEIDPMSHNFLADLGQLHYFAREYDEAEASCRRALEVYPTFVFAHQYLFETCFAKGEYDEAFKEYIKWTGSSVSDTDYSDAFKAFEAQLTPLYLRSGFEGVLRDRIDQLLRGPQGEVSYQIAKAYAMLGEKQQTLDWLEKACDSRNLLLAFVNVDPVFQQLHSEPRFQGVLRRMGLA